MEPQCGSNPSPHLVGTPVFRVTTWTGPSRYPRTVANSTLIVSGQVLHIIDQSFAVQVDAKQFPIAAHIFFKPSVNVVGFTTFAAWNGWLVVCCAALVIEICRIFWGCTVLFPAESWQGCTGLFLDKQWLGHTGFFLSGCWLIHTRVFLCGHWLNGIGLFLSGSDGSILRSILSQVNQKRFIVAPILFVVLCIDLSHWRWENLARITGLRWNGSLIVGRRC
jgi:hypothetical protein